MPEKLQLTGDPEADKLLSEDPFALVTGMLLDQQFPMERAFASPAELARRLGVEHLDPDLIARMDPEKLIEVFATRPALHRYPASMARRVHASALLVVDQYGGDASAIWRDARSGQDLFDRVVALPGFGQRKAHIFVALLGKQLGIRPRGWRQAATPFGEPGSYLSIADVVDGESLARVRTTKQAAKRAARASAGAAEDGH